MTTSPPDWPTGKYGAILIDVPAKFVVRSAKGLKRSPDRHYSTMTVAELKALPVRDLCANDAFVFYWTTGAQLPNALKILEAWNLRFSSTAFIWVKLNHRHHKIFWTRREFFMGAGYTTRKNVEICLLATVGNPKRKSKKVEELIIAAKREHSRKPDEIYGRIEAFAEGPYLELFSRTSRKNWTVWGNQTGLFPEVAA